MTTRGLLVLAIAALAVLAGCSMLPKSSQRPARGIRESAPSLGYLEHRGQTYPLRDLLDPRFRAQSRDPFARDFDPAHHIADLATVE